MRPDDKITRIENIKDLYILDATDKEKEWLSDYDKMEGYKIQTYQQSIYLLIDNEQSCCENWGYFFTEDNPDDFIGADVISVKITDTARNVEKYEIDHLDEDTHVLMVDIETSKGVLQFVAYNQHNGYYGHRACVVSKDIRHWDCL